MALLLGPVISQEALEGDKTTLFCDSTTDYQNDELMLLVWYKDNVPIYRYVYFIYPPLTTFFFNK